MRRNKLVEVYNPLFEGEYDQYFFVIDDEEIFIQDLKEHLEEIDNEFPMFNPLGDFMEYLQVDVPLHNQDHLGEFYFINYWDGKWLIEKHVYELNSKEIGEVVLKNEKK